MQLSKIAGIFLAWAAWLSGAPRAEAAMVKLQLQEVTPLGYSGEVLRLRVALPCGAKFYGLVASGDSQGQVLRLAAAVTEGAIICTSIPETVEVGVDYLATHAFRKIAPMAIHPGQRLVTVPMDELRLAGSGASASLYAVYASRCGQEQGILIHRSSRTRLELAVVETSDLRHKLATCKLEPRTRRLNTLAAFGSYQIRPLPERYSSLVKAYTLMLAPVRRAVGTAGGLRVSYERACNEAPIGMVVRGGSSVVQVGVLVARYTNMRCRADASELQQAELTEPALALGRGTKLQLLTGRPGLELSLRAPSELVLEAPVKGRRSLHLSYISGCSAAYPVYSEAGGGVLAVGVLMVQDGDGTGDASACRQAPAVASEAQPYLAASVQADQVYPLRLK